MYNRPVALGIHIFAGGFTLGVKQARFQTLGHLENTKYGVSTAKLNWPQLDIRIGEENWRAEEFTGKVDLLYSNPPCAIFSTAGISTTRGSNGWRYDPRLQYWYQAFSVFEVIKPKVFALESVCQAYTKGRKLIDNFTQKCLATGYSVQHILMDAKWVGVPQSRKRFFFIAYKPWFSLEFRFDFSEPPTVGETLETVNDPGNINYHNKGANFAQWISKTPQSGKLRQTFDKFYSEQRSGKGSGRPGFMYSRLRSDCQMGTFTGDMFSHPVKNRFLGINEMRVLCGYPLDFELVGTKGQQPSLLARAVLPPVGKWLSTAVKKVIQQPRQKYCQPTVTLVDLRKPFGIYSDLTQEYTSSIHNRQQNLLKLICRVKSCNLCPRMRGCHRVLSQLNGPATAKMMFIGEAPGRNGAGISGIPFYGDATGLNFETLIKSAGLTRSKIFITNTVLCNPIGPDGKNASPSGKEIDNCLHYLRQIVDIVNPKVVVSLGAVALTTLNRMKEHKLRLSRDVGRVIKWYDKYLVPLYHPSPRVLAIRSMAKQRKDFCRLAKLMKNV